MVKEISKGSISHYILEPGDASRYSFLWGLTKNASGSDSLFFAFNIGDDQEMSGHVWPTYLGYIAWGYFREKHSHLSEWTAAVGYLVLLHLLGQAPDFGVLEDTPVEAVNERLRTGWLDGIESITSLHT